MVESTPEQHEHEQVAPAATLPARRRTSGAASPGARRRRRRMSAMRLAAVVAALATAAAVLPSAAHAQSAAASASAASDPGQFLLVRSAASTSLNNTLQIAHRASESATAVPLTTVQSVTSDTAWSLDVWDASFKALESQVKTLAPSLSHLDLIVQLDQTLAVQSLAFEHGAPWSFGPTLVFAERSLDGLKSLKTLKFAKFNVTFEDKAWLPSPASLQQLVFDQCTVPFFTVDTTAVVSEVIFRGSNLTSFPNFLLHLKTPIKTLTFENNQIVRPISMTSSELEQLKSIQSVVFKGNVFVSASTALSGASTTTDSGAVATPANTEASCENPTTYQNIPICVSDLTFRSANKSQIIADDNKAGSSDTQGAAAGSSSKLMNSVIIILAACGVALLAIASVIYRKRRRATTYSGDTRSSFYENSDVLLSPGGKLEPAAPKDEPPAAALTAASGLQTQASANSVGVAELDLGREVVHLGKKLGIHGLRKGEYRDAPVVALRVSLRSLHISMREANRIVASYVPLRHRNVVELIGTSMTALEDLLIVVEYMGKGSLRSVLRNPKLELSWHERVRMGADVCRALEFLAAARPSAVSKNLSTKSVLVTNELVCKLDLFDYGRKVRDHVAPVLSFGQCEIASRAPEVLAGGAVTRAAEVYALGVILCELSLRQMPFEDIIGDKGPTLGELFIAREVVAQRLALAPAPDAPADFRALAASCLAFEPAQRPAVPDVLQALQAMLRT